MMRIQLIVLCALVLIGCSSCSQEPEPLPLFDTQVVGHVIAQGRSLARWEIEQITWDPVRRCHVLWIKGQAGQRAYWCDGVLGVPFVPAPVTPAGAQLPQPEPVEPPAESSPE